MKDREHEIQCECVRWFRLRYRGYRIFAVPNGGERNVAVAQKLKAEGVSAGVPDLCIPVPMGGYHGLWIEMKKSRVGVRGELVDKGVLSENQKDWIEYLRGMGYRVEVAYSVGEFMGIIGDYLG